MLSNQKPTNTFVSIGMPVYNGENYIRHALDSLLEQDHQDFELIVSDNASTDATAQILSEYASKDSRIKYYRQSENIGAARNFRFVLDKAKGEFFMWMAHDDLRDPNWISTLLSEFNDGDLGVIGGIRFLRNDGVYIKHLRRYFKGGQFTCFMGNECDYRCCYVYALFRRELLVQADFRPISLDYSPDYVFVYSLLKQGNLRATDKTLMSFRVHASNAGNGFTQPWKGWRKNVYRIHPLRYYLYHLPYTEGSVNKLFLFSLIPAKHLYAQASFWIRGIRELLTGKRFI